MASTKPSSADLVIRLTSTVGVIVLAGIAAVISYKHMYELVLRYGETSWTAALLPVSVDGMIAVASMSLLADSRHGRRGGLLPWTLLVLGSAASLAANVAVAEPSVVGRLIAAWPSCALIGAYELLMRQVRYSAAPKAPRGPSRPYTSQASSDSASYVSSYDPLTRPDVSDVSHTSVTEDAVVLDGSSYEAHTTSDPDPAVPYGALTSDAGLVPFADGLQSQNGVRPVSPLRGRSRPASILQRQAWQWAQVNRSPAGDLPSGKEIAQRFGRRERWGRLVKQAGLAGRLDPAPLTQ